MDADTVISKILSRVDAGATHDSLRESTIATEAPELLHVARAAFGSWDVALAATLIHLRSFYERLARNEENDDSEVIAADEPRPERRVTGAADMMAWVLTSSGQALTRELTEFAATEQPTLCEPLFAGDPRHSFARLQLGDGDTGVVLITATGKALAIDQRLLPTWAAGAPARLVSQRFEGLDAGDSVIAAIPRSALRTHPRFYTVSAHGNLKATDCDELRKLSSEALAAALVRDGDHIVDVFTGPVDATICVLSSHARAIVFDAAEVRSQGRKATGVRAIALEGDAQAIGAFAVRPGDWIALATAGGMMKRMRASDFRPQGRAGGGLQSCRLQGTDRVVCSARLVLADDVFVVTNRGRWARFAAFELPFGARSARGERILDLEDGEQIVSMQTAPAGTIA